MIILVMVTTILPMILVGILAGTSYVVYVTPSPFILILFFIILWRVLITERKAQNNITPMTQLPAKAANNRPQVAVRDREAGCERSQLIQPALPRRTHVYNSMPLPGYHAQSKLKSMSTVNVKKVTSITHQEGKESENLPIAMVDLVEDNQNIKWWNKELTAYVVK